MADPEDGDGLIADVADFAEYAPILGCATVPLCAATLAGVYALQVLDAPRWSEWAVALVYVTFPYAAFTRWLWRKKAIRLRNGRIVGTREARRLALTAWAAVSAIILWRMLTW